MPGLQSLLINRTTTVQQIINQCSLHTKLQNFFLNVNGTNEPGMTICNAAQQMLLARPFAWKFNRTELNGRTGQFFVTQYGVQDYQFAGACAFVLSTASPSGGVGIDLAANPVNGGDSGVSVSGSVVTIQTLDPHPFQVGQAVYMTGNVGTAYNSTFSFNSLTVTSGWSNGWVITAVPDKLHFQFTKTGSQGDPSGAPGITNWGWMESAYLTDINSTAFPQPVRIIGAVDRLAPESGPRGDQLQVAMMQDNNNGVLLFRLSEPVGTYCFQVNTVYQARSSPLTQLNGLGGTFQWPDNLMYVLLEVALWYAFRFATEMTSEETKSQMMMAQQAIGMALQGEDREDTAEALVPARSFMA